MTGAGLLFVLPILAAGAAAPAPVPGPAPAPAARDATAALVVLGEPTDAGRAQAGALHAHLESRFAAWAGTDLLRRTDAAARTRGVARKPAIGAVEQQKADRLLDQMNRAYYEGRLDDAAARLSELSTLLDTTWLPTSTRVAMLLWRGAIFLERGENRAAEAPVREVLVLSPSIVVDERTYPPPLVALVKRLRTRPQKKALLTLTGLPPGAEVTVDDAPASETRTAAGLLVPVTIGRHRVVASAPGHDYVALTVDVRGDVPLAMPLPLALDEASATALRGAPFRDEASVAELLALEQLQKALDVKTVFVVVHRAQEPALGVAAFARGRVDRAGAQRSGGAGEAAIAAWIEKRLPRPRRPSTPGTDAWIADAGLATEIRVRQVTGGGVSYAALFPATGPRIRLAYARRAWEGSATVAWLSAPMSAVHAEFEPSGASSSGGSGSTTRARIRGGWRGFGERDGAFSAAFGAGVAWERFAVRDVRRGGPVGLFPSSERLSLEAVADAHLLLSGLRVGAELAVSPWSSWSEDPRGASGDSPAGAPAFGWALSVGAPRGAWHWSAAYEGALQSARFDGTSPLPSDPPLRDAVVSDQVHTVTLSVGRRF